MAEKRAAPSRRTAILVLTTLALALSACTPGASPSPVPTPTATLATGVQGTILAGPTCPVERAGESACVRPVAGALILALNSDRHEVGRAVSDDSGAYLLRLPPGTYAIVPQPVSGLMRAAPETTVTVTDGPPLQLDLSYDTGIR